MSGHLGSSADFVFQFVNTDGDVADPTTVHVWLREQWDGTELGWLYDAAPVEGTHYPTGFEPVERTGTGAYTLPWVRRKPERITCVAEGDGNDVTQTITLTDFCRHSELESLEG